MGYKKAGCYVLQLSNDDAYNMNDSTTYYVGNKFVTDNTYSRFYIPRNGTVRTVYVQWKHITQDCTAEDTTISIDVSGTATTVYTGSMANAQSPQNTRNLNKSVTAGQYILLKIETPAWVTNPQGTYIQVTIEISY